MKKMNKLEKNLNEMVEKISKIEELKKIFPDTKLNKDFTIKILPTSTNLKILLDLNKVELMYNVISKKICIKTKNEGVRLLQDRDLSMYVRDELLRLGIPTDGYELNVTALAMANEYNPAAEFILSKKWDGGDRIQALANTLTTESNYDTELKYRVLRKWLHSLVVAALYDPKEILFSTRNILTLKGVQNLGKTRWLQRLFPKGLFKDGVCIDPNNKDSMLLALSYWCVELGELERVFRRDVSALKAALTMPVDDIRKPFGKISEIMPRRTVYAATVNMDNFLADETGSSRFSIMPVLDVDYNHRIDPQQIFAQIYEEDYCTGKSWFLDSEDLIKQCLFNENYDITNETAELIVTKLCLPTSMGDIKNSKYVNATEILNACGIEIPNKSQCNQAVEFLKKHMKKYKIEYKKIGGSFRFPMPRRRRLNEDNFDNCYNF